MFALPIGRPPDRSLQSLATLVAKSSSNRASSLPVANAGHRNLARRLAVSRYAVSPYLALSRLMSAHSLIGKVWRIVPPVPVYAVTFLDL